MYINGKKFCSKRYSSGELKLLKNALDDFVQNGKVEILFVGKNYTIFELLIIIDYYINKNILVDLILAYLPYQRMDHKGTNEIDTLSNVANILNKFSLHSVTICEPHSSINQIVNSKTFSYIKNLKDKVFEDINFDNNVDTVILTDKGGLCRYNSIAKNVVYFEKTRDKQTGLIIKHNIVGNFDVNSKVVIVDDIISTGDTIVNIVEYITKLGAKEIYVFAGHLEKNKYNKRLLYFENVKKIFSTNSLSNVKHKKIQLFDVKELFYGKERR